MKIKMLSIMVAMLFLPLVAVALPSDAQLEKPNWGVGDYWVYSGSYSGTASMAFENSTLQSNIDSTVSLRVDVKDIEVKNIDGKYMGCYITDVESSVGGTYTYKFGQQSYSGNFKFSVNGTSWFSTDDLAIVKSDIEVTIDINIPNVPKTLSTDTDYGPPFDFMDFPVSEGERWTASTTAKTSYMGGEPTPTPLSFSFECTGTAGDKYIIRTDYIPFIGDLIPINNTLILWSDSKGMIDSVRGNSPDQNLQISLTDYRYEGQEDVPPDAKFSYDRSSPSVGDIITFDGSASTDTDGSISFYQWDFGDGYDATGSVVTHQYGAKGNYTVTLTVIDNYGQSDTYTKTITVSGASVGGGGGGSTPGFGMMSLLVAMFAVALLVMKRK
ncbi:MAG: PKD domain-containing protein [Thermoplasmata archaeon]|nr:PKD domain-containing protein [Thermoplasmata archaeon]